MNTTLRADSVLRIRDYRLLWTGETIRTLGNSVTSVTLPLIAVTVLETGATAVGVLAAAVWLPWLLIGLPAGAWVDGMRRRPVMIACNLVSAALCVSVPLAAWLDALTFAHLLIVALTLGTSAVFFNTANHAYLPTVLPAGALLQGNATLQASESATRVAGPGLAGLLTQLLGAVAGLLLDALTFLLATLCLTSIRARERAPAPDATAERLGTRIREGLRFVLRDRHLRPMVVYGALVNLALMGYQAVHVVFLVLTVGVDPVTLGLLLTAGSVGGIIGAAFAGAVGRRFGTGRGMLLVQVVTGPFALLMPLTTEGAGLALYAVGAFGIGLGITACNVVLGSFRQAYCPPHLLGRVVATTMVLNHSTIPLGSLLGGFLGDAIGPRQALWVMTALLAPCWLVLALGPMRHARDLPTTPHPTPETHPSTT
ncbi:MFS transporter [Streptomyces sp. NPDC097619]|uniref:MFS transporter n=1 Tax=Streptomyces sp. NPDC097619 TaxID=3157228 RepID=UPI0033261E58